MNNKKKAQIILRILNKTYPKVPIPLNYKNTFTLLVSVLLSAQCTDVNVNNVTKEIYPKFNKPEHFMKLGRKKIEKLIKRIGIFRVKAKSIFYLSKTLVEKYKGKVPKNVRRIRTVAWCRAQNCKCCHVSGIWFSRFSSRYSYSQTSAKMGSN